MQNAEIADRLDAFASLLELADSGPYTIRAYRRAAETVRGTLAPVAELVRTGRVRRGWIGVAVGTRPLAPAARVRLGRATGVEVAEVEPDGPGARAGVRAEDVLVALDGRPVTGVGDLQRLLSGERVGGRVALEVLRAERSLTLEVVPAELS